MVVDVSQSTPVFLISSEHSPSVGQGACGLGTAAWLGRSRRQAQWVSVLFLIWVYSLYRDLAPLPCLLGGDNRRWPHVNVPAGICRDAPPGSHEFP